MLDRLKLICQVLACLVVEIALAACSPTSSQDATAEPTAVAPEQSAPNADRSLAVEGAFATAEEEKVFATLEVPAQTAIKAAYAECMVELKEFAKDASGGDADMKSILLDDGAENCYGQRNSRIRSARARQSIEEITLSITTGK